MKIRKTIVAIVAILALLVFTGCSTVSTEPDERALHYSGGSFSSKNFKNCVSESERDVDGPGDKHYIYPYGQRTFSFTGKEGSESDPISVTTSDGQELAVPGFITFTLNTDCETLQDFHEKIGIKYGAYKGGGGWDDFLNDYIYTPLSDAMNEAALDAPGWQSLYANSATKDAFAEQVKEDLPSEIESALGDDYLSINSVNISKPDVSDDLKASLEAKEQARLDNEAQKELNAKVRTQYQVIEDCLATGLDRTNCTLIFLSQNDADIPFLPIAPGGGVNYTPPSG